VPRKVYRSVWGGGGGVTGRVYDERNTFWNTVRNDGNRGGRGEGKPERNARPCPQRTGTADGGANRRPPLPGLKKEIRASRLRKRRERSANTRYAGLGGYLLVKLGGFDAASTSPVEYSVFSALRAEITARGARINSSPYTTTLNARNLNCGQKTAAAAVAYEYYRRFKMFSARTQSGTVSFVFLFAIHTDGRVRAAGLTEKRGRPGRKSRETRRKSRRRLQPCTLPENRAPPAT